MRIVSFVFTLLIVISFLFLPVTANSQPSAQYLIKTLDLLAEKALDAYMLEDYISFYQYYAKKMDSVTSQRHFENTFVKIYKKDLGNVISRKLLPKKSTLDHDFPVLVYEARFEKFEPVLITVNYANEYNNYRITRIRFDKVHNSN